MMVLDYSSNRVRQVRWPQEAFGGAPLHLAWRSEAISWKLFPTPKPHCPWPPELPKPPSQLPFCYCSPTVFSLKSSFLKLSSSLLQPELIWPSLTPPFAGNFLEDSQTVSVVSAGRETRCSIQQVPGSSPSLCLIGQALHLFCSPPSALPPFGGGWT